MTYFICSRSDTAGHFFELTKEVNSQGRLANILSIGQANPLLASFGMPDIYHDMSRDHLYGDFQADQDGRNDIFQEIALDIIDAVRVVGETIIMEVGTEIAIAIAEVVGRAWENKRVVFYCTEQTLPFSLKSQIEIMTPDAVLMANRKVCCCTRLNDGIVSRLKRVPVYDLGFRFSYARDQIHERILQGAQVRESVFEERRIIDKGHKVISILGSLERDPETRGSALSLMIGSLEHFIRKNEEPLIIFHRLGQADPEGEKLALGLFEKGNKSVTVFFEEAIPFECLAISDYVFSLKSAIAVECMWAGLNVIGFGSLEDRKQVPCYAFPNVARYANSLFAFRKILEEGNWRVNRQSINEVFGYREDWEDRLAAILYNVRLALTAQPMALHA